MLVGVCSLMNNSIHLTLICVSAILRDHIVRCALSHDANRITAPRGHTIYAIYSCLRGDEGCEGEIALNATWLL